ncbi:MAG: dTDP-4-amino-4,6-dideoxygalactose transaminase [Burkholderiales bacterium]|nr:dTDP-4-amino-4,6-dideoxygalactose transaminase [Burkholderiales bacterium]
MSSEIPFNIPSFVGKELYYIAQAVDGGQLSGDGAFSRRCEKWMESAFGSSRALLTHSCTAALEMSALMSDVGPGDEVIVPSWTFVTSASAYALRGAKLVFVDVRDDTLNIDEKMVERAVTSRTKAIVCVHYAGVPCEMDALKTIAGNAGALLVEDAAQAFHSQWQGQPAGAIADLGCFSFHETKNISCGEGGALLVNRPDLVERAEIIREKGTNRSRFFRGQVDKYTWVDLGSSFLPNDLSAAFLYAQLEHGDEITRRRRELVGRYTSHLRPLAETGAFKLPAVDLATVANGHMMYIMLPDLAARTQLLQAMRQEQIGTVFHYVPLHSSPAGEQYGRAASDMAVTNSVAERLVRLPLFSSMSNEQQDRVITALYRHFGHDAAAYLGDDRAYAA